MEVQAEQDRFGTCTSQRQRAFSNRPPISIQASAGDLLAAIDRLTNPAQMGEVFKVALLVPAGTGQPPGFETEGSS